MAVKLDQFNNGMCCYGKDGNLTEDFVTFQERKYLSNFRPEELTTLRKGDNIHQILEDLTTAVRNNSNFLRKSSRAHDLI